MHAVASPPARCSGSVATPQIPEQPIGRPPNHWSKSELARDRHDLAALDRDAQVVQR